MKMQEVINLNINQEEAMKLKLTLMDVLLLKYIYEVNENNDTLIFNINGDRYFYIDEKEFLKKYPFLGFGKNGALVKRLCNFTDRNLLWHKVIFNRKIFKINMYLIEKILNIKEKRFFEEF